MKQLQIATLAIIFALTPLILEAQDARAGAARSPAAFAGVFVGKTYELQDSVFSGPYTVKVEIRTNGTGYFYYNKVGTSFLNKDPLTVNSNGRLSITGATGLARGDVVIKGNLLKGSYAGQLGGIVYAGTFRAFRR
jgi:hypothetical protein